MWVVRSCYINCLGDFKRLRVGLAMIKHAIEFINCELDSDYI